MTASARATPSRYNAVAMLLHWLIAAAIIANILIAMGAEDLPRPERMAWMGWHKSIGLAVLLLSIARVAWRVMNPVPAQPPGSKAIKAAAAALHHTFYLLMILVPLGGWLLVSTHGNPISFFGLFDWPAFPGLTSDQHELFETGHVVAGLAMAALIPLHVAAGLFHHFIVKDDVFLRMLPGTKLRSGD